MACTRIVAGRKEQLVRPGRKVRQEIENIPSAWTERAVEPEIVIRVGTAHRDDGIRCLRADLDQLRSMHNYARVRDVVAPEVTEEHLERDDRAALHGDARTVQGA